MILGQGHLLSSPRRSSRTSSKESATERVASWLQEERLGLTASPLETSPQNLRALRGRLSSLFTGQEMFSNFLITSHNALLKDLSVEIENNFLKGWWWRFSGEPVLRDTLAIEPVFQTLNKAQCASSGKVSKISRHTQASFILIVSLYHSIWVPQELIWRHSSSAIFWWGMWGNPSASTELVLTSANESSHSWPPSMYFWIQSPKSRIFSQVPSLALYYSEGQSGSIRSPLDRPELPMELWGLQQDTPRTFRHP